MGFFDLFRRKHSRSAQIPRRTLSESERVALAIKALGAHLSADSDPREIAAFGFCGALLEETFVPQFLASLPTDTADQLPPANRIESHIFELWLWSHTLRRLGSLERADLVAVLDAFHLYVYRALVLLGITEAEIMHLQKRLPGRYEEAEVFLRSPDENLQGELKRSLLASLNRRNTDYGSCQKLLPEKDEGAKGTLFWEFGKVIAETPGRPKDVFVIMTATSVGLAALKMLDLKAALQRTFD